MLVLKARSICTSSKKNINYLPGDGARGMEIAFRVCLTPLPCRASRLMQGSDPDDMAFLLKYAYEFEKARQYY